MAFPPKPAHSDTVAAVDRWGNMTAVTHSINCVFWGRTGITVDGVSIGDPASFQQALDAPAILVPYSALTGPGRLASAVMQGDFDAGLLEQVAYEINQVPQEQRFWHEGLWVGIHRDPETGEVRAASHAHTNARALAH